MNNDLGKVRSMRAFFTMFVLAMLACRFDDGRTARKNGGEAGGTPQAAKPGAAEMERLKFYLGEWDYTETYPKSAFSPNGGKNTGVYTSKLGPGGQSLVNSFHSQGPVGDFEGLIVMTWDAREKAYKAYVFGNGIPGAVVETGQFEGDALVYRFEFPAEGGVSETTKRHPGYRPGNAGERRIHDHERRARNAACARGCEKEMNSTRTQCFLVVALSLNNTSI